MALIEYATDEITQQVLWFCTCGDMSRVIGNHAGDCGLLPVMRLLDKALAEQQERIAADIEEHDAHAGGLHPSGVGMTGLRVAAVIARNGHRCEGLGRETP